MNIFVLAFAMLFSSTLFADTTARFLWSDTRGFVAADASCQVRQEDQVSFLVPFFISQKPNSRLNDFSKLKGTGFFGGWISGKLLDRSLITAKDAADPTDGSLIRVLSVAKNATRPDAMHISEAGDEGYLAKESLQDIGNFVIQIIDYGIEAPATLSAVQAEAPFKIQKSFWQVTTDNGKLTTLTCGDITKPVHYLLFDVYESTSIDPVVQVGLNPDEIKILGSINVYTPDEANQVVSGKSPIQEPPKTPAPGDGQRPPGGVVTPTPHPKPHPPPPPKDDDSVDTSEGELEYVICSEAKTTAILAKDLKTKVFLAHQFESVIPSQSWDEKKKTTHLEVQFPNRNEVPNSGWIPRDLVQLRSECAALDKSGLNEGDSAVDDSLGSLDPRISRKDCCKFPTPNRPSTSYASGSLQFRAQRNRGRRRHAGCDLYRKKGEAAVAVASGTILRGMYYFYQGVFAIEVKHPKFIARYGEVLGKYPKGIAKGKNVVAGQEVGYIGKVNSGCCTPMLHFEMFRGTSHGSLSRNRFPPYDRRSDVMDPTDSLRQWEKNQFGISY